ncbi:MAG: ATP-binding protein [Chloroflexi bacterium]|nr:ATP-binding protein [Chloroflexota bacterium]
MNEPENPPKYSMTVSLSVYEHLGKGLYSNIPAVLSEVVANAWDADAENIWINIDPKRGRIEITDDGHGMTDQDINEKYLKIGYKKREQPDFSMTQRFRRQPMGRKGIGKLSVFAIADRIEVHTVRCGQRNALRLDNDKIIEAIRGEKTDTYIPDEIPPAEVEITKGTKLILTEVRARTYTTGENLRRRLARRFSIIGTDHFNVYINDKPISARDRDYHKFVEYLWYFNRDISVISAMFTAAKCKTKESGHFGEDDMRTISGWIGTVHNQQQISEETNGIVLFANGKLVHEDVLADMKEGGVWTKYVIGEIDADYLDDNESEDIITSARQSLKEDDERYTDLRDFLKNGVVRNIATNWQRLRITHSTKKVLSDYPNIRHWLSRFEGDQQTSAEMLLGKIESLDDLNESEKVDLFRGTMYLFERLRATSQLELLKTLKTKEDFERFVSVFADLTELERVPYYRITKGRVVIVKKFKEIMESNQVERTIQELIFNSLWLLNPSWERATTNKHMEKRITTQFKKAEPKLSKAQKLARVDIRYQTVAGKHVLIELKKFDARIQPFVLLKQVSKYRTTLRKCLEIYHGEAHRNMVIEVVCIIGSRPTSWDAEEMENHFRLESSRVMTYDELLADTLNTYQEYLDVEEETSELIGIINKAEHDVLIKWKEERRKAQTSK